MAQQTHLTETSTPSSTSQVIQKSVNEKLQALIARATQLKENYRRLSIVLKDQHEFLAQLKTLSDDTNSFLKELDSHSEQSSIAAARKILIDIEKIGAEFTPKNSQTNISELAPLKIEEAKIKSQNFFGQLQRIKTDLAKKTGQQNLLEQQIRLEDLDEALSKLRYQLYAQKILYDITEILALQTEIEQLQQQINIALESTIKDEKKLTRTILARQVSEASTEPDILDDKPSRSTLTDLTKLSVAPLTPSSSTATSLPITIDGSLHSTLTDSTPFSVAPLAPSSSPTISLPITIIPSHTVKPEVAHLPSHVSKLSVAELPGDAQELMAKFLSTNDLTSIVRQDSKLLPRLIPELISVGDDKSSSEFAPFWDERAKRAYNDTSKIKSFNKLNEIGAKEYETLKKYFDGKKDKNIAPFESIDDIQRFLIAIREGDLDLLLTKYSSRNAHLILQTLESIGIDPSKIVNQRLNETGQAIYQEILALLCKVYLRDQGCLTKTPTGEDSLNLGDEVTTQNSIIGVLVYYRQLELLKKFGYPLNRLVESYWFSVMENAISSGNLDLCKEIIEIIPDIQQLNIPLSVNKPTPLSCAIEQHQFEIARLFYGKLFEVKKNSLLAAGSSEQVATQRSHRALIFDYLRSSSTISKYAFCVLQKFAESDQQLVNDIIKYQAIYIQFINGIVKNDVDSINDAIQQLNIFFQEMNLPGSQTVLDNWIRDQAHAELGSRTVTQFLAALPPQQAIERIQPFVTTLARVDDNHHIGQCYLVGVNADPSTRPIDIAYEAALTHKNLDFMMFMFNQNVPVFSIDREKQKQLLMMALENDDTDQINFFSNRFVLRISDILEFAIKHDERKRDTATSESLLTITWLKKYFKARERYLLSSQINYQLNELLCDEKNQLTVPAICRAVETNNFALVQGLFEMGAKLDIDSVRLRSPNDRPLALAAAKGNIDMVVLLLQLNKKNGCKLELESQSLLLELYQSTPKYLPAASILRYFLKRPAALESVKRVNKLFAVLTYAIAMAGLLTILFGFAGVMTPVPWIVLLAGAPISRIMFSLGEYCINHFHQTTKDLAVTFTLIGVTIALFAGLALLLAPSAAFSGITLAPLIVGFFVATLFFTAAGGLIAVDKPMIGVDGNLKLPHKTEAGTPNMGKSLGNLTSVSSSSKQKSVSSVVLRQSAHSCRFNFSDSSAPAPAPSQNNIEGSRDSKLSKNS